MTPEKAINLTWFSVALSFCWPLPTNSSRNQMFGYKVAQIFSVFNVILLPLASLYTIYLRSDDIEIVLKCTSQTICGIQSVTQTFICFCKHDTLQRIVDELWTCIREAQQYEREIFCTYTARYSRFYGTYVVCAYAIVIVYFWLPLFLPIYYIVYAEYPFDVNHTSMTIVVRAQQFIACHQCCAHVCVCVFGASLIWFTAARFECLGVEIQRCTDIHMLAICIEKQLRLRRYAHDVISCFRFMILFVIITCTLMMTTCAVVIITVNSMQELKLLSAVSALVFLMYLYMYAWPADHMKDMSLSISRSVYELKWYDKMLGLQKDLLTVLVCQSPVKLSINFLVPELSLNYYCTYVSNALSMCTALRAVLDKSVA